MFGLYFSFFSFTWIIGREMDVGVGGCGPQGGGGARIFQIVHLHVLLEEKWMSELRAACERVGGGQGLFFVCPCMC